MSRRPSWSKHAIADVERLGRFLAAHNPAAAQKAVHLILGAADQLIDFPESGRPFAGAPDQFRELLVHFGRSGYVLLYDLPNGRPPILAVKHFRELGYQQPPIPQP